MTTQNEPKRAIISNPFLYVPKVMFFAKGKGLHKDQLTSFELALRDAGIADLNLVSVSSIKPTRCKIVSKQDGRKYLVPGQIVFTVIARCATNEPNRLIAASIGLSRPADDDSQYGYLSEHHSTGEICRRYGHGNAGYHFRFNKRSISYMGSKKRRMETFRKNLQNTKLHSICRGT
jgi:arginine decarboxylase